MAIQKQFCPYCGQYLNEDCGCERLIAEEQERFLEDYNNDPMVQAGWSQQDLIDAYRRER